MTQLQGALGQSSFDTGLSGYQLQEGDQDTASITQPTLAGAHFGEAYSDVDHFSHFGNFPWSQEPTYQTNNNVGSSSNNFLQQPWNNHIGFGYSYSDDTQATALEPELLCNIPQYLPGPFQPTLNPEMRDVTQPPPNIEPAPASLPIRTPWKADMQADIESRIHCPKGCTATFGRSGDFRRHMRKHEKPRYKCIVLDCERTFARFDKLRDHIRQGHKLKLA